MNDKSEQSPGKRGIFEHNCDETIHIVFPTDSNPYGLSYREWTTKWWRWLISIPLTNNPARDLTGESSDQNQNDENVWFLAGTVKPFFLANRTCQIPVGKAVLFPIVSTVISYAEDPSLKTESDLISFAGKDIAQASHLEVEIDGIKLEHLEDYRVNAGPFDLTYPSNNIFEVSPGLSTAASDGFWVFLKPLVPGLHKIHLNGVEPNFSTEVWYLISVT